MLQNAQELVSDFLDRAAAGRWLVKLTLFNGNELMGTVDHWIGPDRISFYDLGCLYVICTDYIAGATLLNVTVMWSETQGLMLEH